MKLITYLLMGLVGYVSVSIGFFLSKLDAFAILILLVSSIVTGVSIYFMTKRKKKQKSFKRKCYKALNGIWHLILYTTVLFAASLNLELFIHETGHAYTALSYKIPIFSIIIIPLRAGFTTVDLTSVHDVSIVSQMIISGGLTISIILVILIIGLLVSSRGLKIEIFIPVYLVLTFNLLNEIEYWIRSLREGAGDAFSFLAFNPSLNISSVMLVLSSIYWTVAVSFYLILGIYLLLKYRKYKILKKSTFLE